MLNPLYSQFWFPKMLMKRVEDEGSVLNEGGIYSSN